MTGESVPVAQAPASPAALEDLDNEALIARCVAGDERAWRCLVDRYKNLVYSVALKWGLSDDEADDVFQLVWLEVHRSLERIRDPQALPRWLIVATRRLCLKRTSRGRRPMAELSADLVDPAALPDEEVERFEIRRRLEWALERLGGTCSRLLRLLFLEDGSGSGAYRRAARETGLALGSIGPVRARCMARLRRLLEESR